MSHMRRALPLLALGLFLAPLAGARATVITTAARDEQGHPEGGDGERKGYTLHGLTRSWLEGRIRAAAVS